MRCGLLDLGSNTVRMVIYELEGESYKRLYNQKAYVGALNFIADGVFSAEGIARLSDAIREMQSLAQMMACMELICFATASLRNLDNADEVIGALHDQCGVEVQIISGGDEAYYDFLGLQDEIGEDRFFGCDLGGGSCQIISAKDGALRDSVSLPLGCLRMYNAFVHGLLPTREEAEKIYHTAKKMVSANDFVEENKRDILYVMGGTGRAMARLHQSISGTEASDVDGYTLAADELKSMIRTVMDMGVDGARLLSRIAPERAHTILPGMLVLRAIAKKAGTGTLSIVKNGVREGYLIHHLLRKA